MKFSYHPVSKLLIMLLPAESKTLSVGTCVSFEDLLLSIDSYVMTIKNSTNRDLSISVLLAQRSFSISLCAQSIIFLVASSKANESSLSFSAHTRALFPNPCLQK
uniref:Uncharacterized protein n=1 Tax=Arundo donax TaxID=35708 RepID=A0A0A9EHG6_ARUDO